MPGRERPNGTHRSAGDAVTRIDAQHPGTLRDSIWPRSLLVLMYHGIHRDRRDCGHYDSRYSVSPTAFDEQMTRLSEWRERKAERAGAQNTNAAARPGSAVSCPTFIRSGAHPVLITFDDGDVSNALRALPCLTRLGLPAVFFVTSGNLRRTGWLSLSQLRELGDAGMSIGSHGATHRFLSDLDARDLRDELTSSRDILEQVSGRPVDWLALPGGRGGPGVRRAAREAGYQRVFGSQPGINSGLDVTDQLQRVAIVRDLDLPGFQQILEWKGTTVGRICWRHRLLALPKALIGDARYDRLRASLMR